GNRAHDRECGMQTERYREFLRDEPRATMASERSGSSTATVSHPSRAGGRIAARASHAKRREERSPGLGLGCVAVRLDRLGIFEGGDDLLLGEPRAVVAFDEKRDTAAVVDVERPAHCLVEHAEFLEQVAILLEGRDRLRAARTGIDAICHRRTSCLTATIGVAAYIWRSKCAAGVSPPRRVDADARRVPIPQRRGKKLSGRVFSISLARRTDRCKGTTTGAES